MDSDREQARRDLIADISHDLRTPLVAMRGYLELLVARGATLAPEDRQRYAAGRSKITESGSIRRRINCQKR